MQGRIFRFGGVGLLAFCATLITTSQASAATTTFTNSAAITVGEGTASPYPSSISVTGLNGPIADLNLTVNNVTHAFPDEMAIVVVGPGGQALLVEDGAGNDDDITDVTTTFDDQAAGQLPDAGAWSTGSYRPTAHRTGDSFPSPGPGTAYGSPGPASGGTGTLNGTFANTNPNGVWSLYVLDAATPDGDSGSIAGGWSLEVTTTPDTVGPDTTITSGPTGLTDSAASTFTFSANETATFQCKLDAQLFSACASPQTYPSLTDGNHTVKVRGIDGYGNTGSLATRTFTVDTRPPNPVINTGPPASTSDPDATFSFSANEPVTFTCKLGSRPFTPCTSPTTYEDIPDGTHIFQLRATDTAGNVDVSGASWTFRVDTVPPNTSIVAGPSGTITTSTASFVFSASQPSTFECSLDAAPFSACNSQQDYENLADGSHTVAVRAIDAAGNVDPVGDSRTFNVQTTLLSPPDTTAPTVTSLKAKLKKRNKHKIAVIKFAGADDSTPASSLLFTCKLDRRRIKACTSPRIYRHLKVGNHTVTVFAADAAENKSAAATVTFKIKKKK